MDIASWEETLGVSASGASGTGGLLIYKFIINFIFPLFLVFHGVGGVRGELVIYQ